MISLRLDAELDARVRAAAAARGESVSEFIRRAAAERADATPPEKSLRQRVEEIVNKDPIHGGGGGVAERASDVFGDMLVEQHKAKRRRFDS
jgi:Ribbon-helix-helix protein, copG family.